jgi:hypothetical protein
MTLVAKGTPTKHFFIENLTRDLNLEDAILDLVDNSIDAFIRTRKIDVSPNLLRLGPSANGLKTPDEANIKVTISPTEISIIDTSGGIPLQHALTNVFRFGRVDDSQESSLGVYGVGLKRAIFKIGQQVLIESRTLQDGFILNLDLPQWADEEKSWDFPLEEIGAAGSEADAGTTIKISNLRPEVSQRIKDPTLTRQLELALSTTYTLFLSRFISISLNGKLVSPRPLPIGGSTDVKPGFREVQVGDVKVEIIAGLAARESGEWNIERAGWYVLCNGRVVVNADKTSLTGWGIEAPQFVSKYRGFVGIAFFFSEKPAELPWTTTKRGLNQEAPVFQMARAEMSLLAKPVIAFLNKMYPSDPAPQIDERNLADAVKVVDVQAVAGQTAGSFAAGTITRTRATNTIQVRYQAYRTDVEAVKKNINQPSWTAGAIGRYTFDYFLKMEIAR